MKFSYKTSTFMLAIFMLVLHACNEDDPFIVDFKHEYYPLTIGHWIEYEVDSFFFFNNALPVVIKDTTSFQIREEIASTFTDAEGRLTYRIERYKRENESQNWVIDRVWAVTRTDINLQKVEDDLRFIKIIFPPELDQTWDGNAFISSQGSSSLDYLQNWTYQTQELDVPDMVNNYTFDSTMTIVQVDNENLIEKTYAVEQYAKNVGLVYKELQVLFKQNVNVGWDQPEFGVIIRHRITNYKDS